MQTKTLPAPTLNTSYTLQQSKRKDKKYTIILLNNKKINFGQKEAEDFTTHKDETRKEAYIGRHQKRESKFWEHDEQNLSTPSYWSRYLLWELPDMDAAIKDIE